MRVGVIDYGVGNLSSVLRALEVLRVVPVLVDRAVDMHGTDCLILPGVGNFGECILQLEAGRWVDALKEEVLGYNKPLLGVCLGMQLLADSSTEGRARGETAKGLGFVPGHVKHLADMGCTNRVPHVGWNSVNFTSPQDQLFFGIPPETDFYFVHSYAFEAKYSQDVIATTNYGLSFTAAVRRGHVWGSQFHPEKSSRAGFRVLRNFIESPLC